MALSSGDILRVTLRHKYQNIHDHVNVLHYLYDGIATPNTEEAVLEDLAKAFGFAFNLIDGAISSRLVAVDIAVFNVTDDAPVGVTSFADGYVGGTGTGNGLPFDSAAVMLAYTNVKRRIGKIFLGGLLEANQDDGVLGAGTVSALGGFQSALLSITGDINGGQYIYIVYNRENAVWSLPSTTRVQPIIGSQDRRKPGRGS